MWNEAKDALRTQIESEMKAAAAPPPGDPAAAAAGATGGGGGDAKPDSTLVPTATTAAAGDWDGSKPISTASDGKENKVPAISETIEPFQLGQIFAHFDENKDGVLDKKEFESLINNAPGLLKNPKQTNEVRN